MSCLRALVACGRQGFALPLTIIGTGPEEASLKELTRSEGLSDSVRFVGALRGEELARELNRHQVMVIPSRWHEPFGIVAVEGIACGCLIVGSEAGGLPDAIGSCGVTFKNGDEIDLARAITKIVEDRELATLCRQATSIHLRNHTTETVARRYIEFFSQRLAPT